MGNIIVTVLMAVALVAAIYHISKLRLRIKELEAKLEERPATVADDIDIVPQESTASAPIADDEDGDFVRWGESDDAAFANELTAYIEANVAETAINADDIAVHMGMSRAQLYRKMKSIMGKTPNDFVRSIRMRKARRLLESHLTATEISISDIAYKCGFTDAKYFSRTFKAMTGKTPKEYRDFCKSREEAS